MAFPPSLRYLIKTENSAPEISYLFGSYLQSTYYSKPYNTTTPYPYYIPHANSVVLEGMSHVDVSYLAGPDKVPSCILKHFA